MSGSRLLRLRVNERLEAAVEEIFGLVEKTIAEYEEEAVRSKREIGQLKQQLEQLVVLKPEVILNRADTQPVFEARPPSLQQYEIMTEESPVLEEVNIQERPRVKEETAERRLSPDVEVDAANEAEVQREINRLQPHTELQAGLKAEGTSSTADTQEVCPSQQPVTVEGTKTHNAEQIQEEQEEVPISPDLEADAFNVYEVGDPDSEPDKYCEPLSSNNESMDDDNERTEVDRPSAERPRRGNKVCYVCGMNFMQDTSLIKHVAGHHKGHKPFRCLQCQKEFNQREHMVSHMWKHTGQKPFRCDFCDKAFLRKDSRLTHMERFHKEKLYCEKCGKYVFNKKHTQFCRGLLEACSTEGLKCSICSKVFKRRHLFVRHASVHNGGKPFGWGFFDDRFTRKSARIIQMQEHDGQKPYPCERCGKAFTSRVYLARHTEGCTGTPNINDLAEPHEAGALTQQPVHE